MTKVINLRNFKKQNLKLNNNKNSLYQKNDVYKIVFTIISILSILSGSLIYKNHQINIISEFCINIIKQLQCDSFLTVFITFLKIDIIYFLSLFFLGSSILGAPLTFVPIILKSVFIGYMSSLIYCEYELKGILFCLIVLYPLFAITTTSLIYAGNESIFMCKFLFDILKNKNTANGISVRLYLIRYVFLLGIILVSVTINSLLTIIIANKFTLF